MLIVAAIVGAALAAWFVRRAIRRAVGGAPTRTYVIEPPGGRLGKTRRRAL